MMADNKEQRLCVKFCFLLGKSADETVLMLQEAFKEEARILCCYRHKSTPMKTVLSTSTNQLAVMLWWCWISVPVKR